MLNIYDEERLAKKLSVQQKHSWCIETDINWNQGIDHSQFLLPITKESKLFPKLTTRERVVLSQLMGLIVSASISELEAISLKLKKPTWERLMDKYPINPEIRELGEQFYIEEAKHSQAFQRYIKLFAKSHELEYDELRSFLPQTRNSLIEKIYKFNSILGGRAMWWLMCAAEEKSILFFKYLKNYQNEVDPLFYQLHKCHFEEEVRHASYAPMMLEIYDQFSHWPQKKIMTKVDFILAEVLNMSWTFSQLIKLGKLKKIKHKSEFYTELYSVVQKIGNSSPFEVLYELFTSTPYVSEMLHLSEHKSIKILLERYNTTNMPLPKMNQMELKCSV